MPFVLAFSVHLFTASGAVLAMLALLAAATGDWSTMYVWLMIALIVDGIDGPLARWAKVKEFAPQWDGALLDMIVDYLTYCFIPAYALFVSGLFPGWTGWISVGVITFTSAIYLADVRMKTEDNSFSGFPACWNMVVLVFFALNPNWLIMTGIVITLAILQFFPVKFVHPVRTLRWRNLTFPMAALWVITAIIAAWTDFENVPALCMIGLVTSSIYLLIAGGLQQLLPERN